jgi:hypothetical protein
LFKFSKLFGLFKNENDDSFFKIPDLCFRIGGFGGREKKLMLLQWFFISCVSYCTFSQSMFLKVHYREVFAIAEASAKFFTVVLTLVKTFTIYLSLEKFQVMKEKIKQLNDEGLTIEILAQKSVL